MNNINKDNLDPILSYIINPETKKVVIIPMDHLWIWTESIKWYANWELAKQVIEWWADIILDHLGWIERIQRMWLQDKAATILHMSISSPIWADPNSKVLVNSVKLASKLWVKWVSLQVNLWHPDDHKMLEDLSRIAWECREFNIPLLAMMYVRTKEDVKTDAQEELAELNKNIGLSARIAEKLWAHIVKLPYTWDMESMKEIVDSLSIPVVVAWWSKESDEKNLQMVSDAMKAWCTWVCMWRNSVERDNVTEFIGVIRRIVHENLNFEDAKKILKLR